MSNFNEVQKEILQLPENQIGNLTDGYHTFDSLYNQRLVLSAALFNAYKDLAWKSKLHNDGSIPFDGTWFICGILTKNGQYTYHYKLKDWDLFHIKTIYRAPAFDGHTDKDVIRLLTLE
jgi:hypothetical protein